MVSEAPLHHSMPLLCSSVIDPQERSNWNIQHSSWRLNDVPSHIHCVFSSLMILQILHDQTPNNNINPKIASLIWVCGCIFPSLRLFQSEHSFPCQVKRFSIVLHRTKNNYLRINQYDLIILTNILTVWSTFCAPFFFFVVISTSKAASIAASSVGTPSVRQSKLSATGVCDCRIEFIDR